MTDQKNLPAKIIAKDVALPTEQSGSLVARGLEAIKNKQLLSLTRESDLERLIIEALDRVDYASVLRLIRPLAEQGHADCQNNLGIMYEFGKGVTQDYAEAAKWLCKAAEQGNVIAQCNLGNLYEYGDGVPQDSAEAAKWYRKAAEQGDAIAQCNLGNLYDYGDGVPQDYAEAAKWYRKAAEQGNADAQLELGMSCDGIMQEYTEAAQCFRIAAEQGNADAQLELGYLYEWGKGVTQDYAEAVKWFRKAADQGIDTQLQMSRLELFIRCQEGGVFEGTVKKIADYGAFIDLGGIDGLLHITDIVWRRIAHPSEVLSVGQRVKVKVTKFDPATKRVSLSMKHLEKSPWEGADKKYAVGTRINGEITQINDYGAFVELEPGIQGLLHVSEIPGIKENIHPSELVSIGQYVDVVVLDIEASDDMHSIYPFRISLGMKQREERQLSKADIGDLEKLLQDAYARGDYEAALGIAYPLAKEGNMIAQYYLGQMYEFGSGVPEYDVEAMKWYRKAAKQGHAASQFKVGLMYSWRKGIAFELVPDFDTKAAKWYREAADQGYAAAQHNLAIMYRNGKGDEPQTSYALDLVQAYKWYSLAGKCFQPSEIEAREASIKACKDLASSMTKEKLAEAERLINEWKPK